MKLFLKNSLKFFVIILSLIVIISFVNYKFIYNNSYFKIKSEKKYLFLGDSHFEYAFNDSNSSFLNICQSAENYYFTYLKLKKILSKNSQIETVLIDFCNSQVDSKNDFYLFKSNEYIESRYLEYYPLFGREDFRFLADINIRGLINAHQKTLMKGIYRIAKNTNIQEDDFLGGHQVLHHELSDTLLNHNYKKNNFKASATSLIYLDKIIKLCSSKNIKIYLVRSPLHPSWEYLGNEYFFQKIKENKFANTEFLDFKDFHLNNNEFADLEHLNEKGSLKFTSFFNTLIREGLFSSKNKQNFINTSIKKIKKENEYKKI